MLVMKNFDIHRFGYLLKLDLSRNKRTYIQSFLGMFLGFLFVGFVSFYPFMKGVYYNPNNNQLLNSVSSYYGMSVMFEFFLSLLFMSHSFVFLKERNRRISYLLLPATQLEKFLARLCLVPFGLLLLSVGSFFTAYMVVSAVYSITQGMPFGEMFVLLWQQISRPFEFWMHLVFNNGTFSWSGFLDMLSSFSMFLFLLSLYLFASLVFRVQPFILMSLCCVAVFGALGMLSVSQYSWVTELIHILKNDALMICLLFGSATGLTLFSYRLFKRKGVNR